MQSCNLTPLHPLRLTQIIVDAGDHLGCEAALMGGVAQGTELLCEIMVEIDPALEFLPGGVWSQGGRVTEGQLCTAVVFAYVIHLLHLIHIANILKINELCKFFFLDFFVNRDTETRRFFFIAAGLTTPSPSFERRGARRGVWSGVWSGAGRGARRGV